MQPDKHKKRKQLGIQEIRRFHAQFVPQDLTNRPYGDATYGGRWFDGVANYSTDVARLVGGPTGGSVDNGDQFLGVELEVSPLASIWGAVQIHGKHFKTPESVPIIGTRRPSGTSTSADYRYLDDDGVLVTAPFDGPPVLKLDFNKDRLLEKGADYFLPDQLIRFMRRGDLSPAQVRGVYLRQPEGVFSAQDYGSLGSYIGCLTAKRLTNYLLKNEGGALKYDASLTGEGFEIVTRPATYEWLMDNVFNDDFFVEHAPYLYSWNNPRCGMHVHMDRDTISSLTEAKMVSFLMNPENERFIDQVAGRGSNGFCHRDDRHGQGAPTPQMATMSRLQRHGAINVSGRNGGRTMEIRIFRGNVSRYGIRRNLEFCLALKAFCEQARISELEWQAYSQWLELPANRTAFPHHARWMKKKSYIDFNFKDYEEILEVA